MHDRIRAALFFAVTLLLAGCAENTHTDALATRAAIPANGVAVRADTTQTVTLKGNVNPLARAEFDQGVVNPETRLDRMVLLLKPSPAQQAALDALVEAQQDSQSPLYHQWLTPAEYGAQFGASRSWRR